MASTGGGHHRRMGLSIHGASRVGEGKKVKENGASNHRRNNQLRAVICRTKTTDKQTNVSRWLVRRTASGDFSTISSFVIVRCHIYARELCGSSWNREQRAAVYLILIFRSDNRLIGCRFGPIDLLLFYGWTIFPVLTIIMTKYLSQE